MCIADFGHNFGTLGTTRRRRAGHGVQHQSLYDEYIFQKKKNDSIPTRTFLYPLPWHNVSSPSLGRQKIAPSTQQNLNFHEIADDASPHDNLIPKLKSQEILA